MSDKTASVIEQVNQPITTKTEIFQYGFGGATLNIAYMTISFYLIFFWTDYAGIAPAIAGGIYFVGRLFMACSDLASGIIIDFTNTKWGKCRPYLMFSSPIIAVFFFLVFTNFRVDTAVKTGIYAVLLIVLCLLFAIQTVAYEAQVPLMSTDLSKRNFVVMTRQVLGTTLAYAAVASTIPMVNFFGGGDRAWQITVAIFAIICLICIAISLNGSKNHDRPTEETAKISTKLILSNFKTVLTVKPVVLLVICFGFFIMANEITGATNMYVFKYAINDPELFSVATYASLPANILSAMLTPFIVAKLGKKRVLVIAALIVWVRPLSFLFIQPFDNKPFIIALYVIQQFGVIMFVVNVWIMVADCVTYVSLTKNISSPGLVTSCNTFMMDFGGAMTGLIVGGLLTLAGYVGTETVETIASSTLRGIILINTAIPMVSVLCAVIIHRFYNVTNKVLADLGANVGNQKIE